VIVRDPESVSERARRPIQAVAVRVFADENTPTDVSTNTTESEALAIVRAMPADTLADIDTLNDLIIVALVQDWSFDGPVTVETLVDLPGKTYQDIRTKVTPIWRGAVPDFDPTPKTDTPTVPSSD
jgi:hypothetical protein